MALRSYPCSLAAFALLLLPGVTRAQDDAASDEPPVGETPIAPDAQDEVAAEEPEPEPEPTEPEPELETELDVPGPDATDEIAVVSPAVDDEPADEVPPAAVPTGPSVYDRYLAIEATGGVDTPFGVVGASVEFTPVRYFAIYAGGGVGRSGGRFVGGVRLQYPMGNGAIGLFGGLAGGPMDWDSEGSANSRIHRAWGLALSIHSGMSFEYRWDVGLYGRIAIGFEALLTPSTPDACSVGDGSACDTYDPEMPALGGDVLSTGLALPIRPWIGLSVGYAFDI